MKLNRPNPHQQDESDTIWKLCLPYVETIAAAIANKTFESKWYTWDETNRLLAIAYLNRQKILTTDEIVLLEHFLRYPSELQTSKLKTLLQKLYKTGKKPLQPHEKNTTKKRQPSKVEVPTIIIKQQKVLKLSEISLSILFNKLKINIAQYHSKHYEHLMNSLDKIFYELDQVKNNSVQFIAKRTEMQNQQTSSRTNSNLFVLGNELSAYTSTAITQHLREKLKYCPCEINTSITQTDDMMGNVHYITTINLIDPEGKTIDDDSLTIVIDSSPISDLPNRDIQISQYKNLKSLSLAPYSSKTKKGFAFNKIQAEHVHNLLKRLGGSFDVDEISKSLLDTLKSHETQPN
jgi:hypothetical protein